MDVVYMNFCKAFHKVPHGRLIQNIKMRRISSDLVVSIQNWLAVRELCWKDNI